MAKGTNKATSPKGQRPSAARLQEKLAVSEQQLAIARNQAAARVVARIGGFEGARSTRHRSDRFVAGSGDYHLDSWTRQRMVESSREMRRNNPLYNAILTRLVDLVVGAGMRPRANTSDKNWNELAERAFARWAMTKVDARGRMVWSMLQRHVCTEAFAAGDVLPIRGGDGSRIIQIIESENIVAPHGEPVSNENGSERMFDGVKMNAQGRALGYWVAEWAAGTARSGGGYIANNNAKLVGARDAGLLAVVDRETQTRGVPILAANMTIFADLREYLDAHRQSAKVQAFFAMIWKSNNPGTDRTGLISGSSQSASGRTQDETEIDSGAVVHIGPNDSIETLRSNAPSALSEPFVRECMTEICASVGIPVNYAMLDFEAMNYSSARAALITAMDGFQHWRNWFAAGFMAPVYRWAIADLIRAGELPYSDEYAHVTFTRPTFGWVDPLKEVQGLDAAVRAGLMSPQEAVAQHTGGDHRDVLRDRASYLAECAEMNLEPPGMMQAAPGSAPPPPEDKPDEEEKPAKKDKPKDG